MSTLTTRPLTGRLEDFAPVAPLAPPQDPIEEPKRNRLNEIAYLVGSLSYGEMIRFAEELWKHGNPPVNHADDLPLMWHRWSKTRNG